MRRGGGDEMVWEEDRKNENGRGGEREQQMNPPCANSLI